MRVGVVEHDTRIHEMIVDSLTVYNHTYVGVDQATKGDIDLIIIHPAMDRNQDEQIRAWHEQHIPMIILSFFEVRDHLLAEEIAAPLFDMPLTSVRDLMETVWDTIIRSQYERARGTSATMYLIAR